MVSEAKGGAVGVSTGGHGKWTLRYLFGKIAGNCGAQLFAWAVAPFRPGHVVV